MAVARRLGRGASASLKPVDPAQFLIEARAMHVSSPCIHPASARPSSQSLFPGSAQGRAFNAPPLQLGPFRPVMNARKFRLSEQTRSSPAAPGRPAEWSFWTLLGATGGTQTHSRRTGRKLGQVRCARQGLVRVPESNTKYGGKAGITGAVPRL